MKSRRCHSILPWHVCAAVIALMCADQARTAAANHQISRDQGSFCRVSRAESVRAALVGRSRAGIAIAAQAIRVAPSGTLLARLINRGPSRASYGAEFRIQRYVDRKWILDDSSPKAFPKRRLGLLPGRAGRCFRYQVPANQAIGRYRLLTFAEVEGIRFRRMISFHIR